MHGVVAMQVGVGQHWWVLHGMVFASSMQMVGIHGVEWGAHIVDTSGSRCWWVVHGVVAVSSLQMRGESMLVGVLGVVSALLMQAVVVIMGGGCPRGRVGAHVVNTTTQVGG